MDDNQSGEQQSVESNIENYSPSQKRRKFDRNTLGHTSKGCYADENSENRNPMRTADYLEEMGLGVLDTDESTSSSFTSNQSSSRNTIISSQPSSVPPASALSLGISDHFGMSEDSESADRTLVQSIDNNDENAMVHFSALNATPHEPLGSMPPSDILSDFLLSDSSNSNSVSAKKVSGVAGGLGGMEYLQDNTPAANLVPLSRSALGVLGENATASATACLSTSAFKVYEANTGMGQPMEGRAIRNTSLIKFSTANSMQKHKGRSPLATVTSNSMHKNCGSPAGVEAKKLNDDGSFFMYQKEDPRVYKGDDNFSKLSDEMILSVFKWLPKKALIRCSLVCHRFNRVSQDESLWSRLDLAGKVIQPYALGRIVLRGVIILRVAQCKILEPIFKISELPMPKYTSKLQFLDLSMATISAGGLVELLSRCTRLKKISLEHVPLNDAVCKELANNRHLEVLNLAMCSGITRYGMRKMMSTLKSLQSLNISWTSLETDSITELSVHVNEHLQRLNIAGCRKTMTDTSLARIVKRCPDLRELDLSDCTLLTSQTIDIVCNLRHLEYLSLSRCYNINVAAYLEINKLLSIAYLDIFGVLSDQALTVLRNNFPDVGINKFIHSAVARPTVGSRRTSIWGIRTRD